MKVIIVLALLLFPLLSFGDSDELSLHLTCGKGDDCMTVTLDKGNISVRRDPEMVLNSSSVARINEVKAEDGKDGLSIHLAEPSVKKFAEVTGQNIGKQLALVLNGRALMAPTIQSRIPSGDVQVTLGLGEKSKFWDGIPWMKEKIAHQKIVEARKERANTIVYLVGGLLIFGAALVYGFRRPGPNAKESRQV